MNKKLNDATKHIKMQGQSLDFGGRAIINAKLINCEGAGGGGSDPNAVKYTEQSLTDSQKAQARTNIGAGSAADVSANAAAIAAETSRAVTAEGTLQEMISAIDRGEGIVAWDGASTPVEAEIPAGVTVTYNNVTYTGTLAASSDTKGPVYYVADGNGNATRYMVSQSGSTYSWLAIGTTEIDLSQYATKAELSQLDQEVKEDGFSVSVFDHSIFASGEPNITLATALSLSQVGDYLEIKVKGSAAGRIIRRTASYNNPSIMYASANKLSFRLTPGGGTFDYQNAAVDTSKVQIIKLVLSSLVGNEYTVDFYLDGVSIGSKVETITYAPYWDQIGYQTTMELYYIKGKSGGIDFEYTKFSELSGATDINDVYDSEGFDGLVTINNRVGSLESATAQLQRAVISGDMYYEYVADSHLYNVTHHFFIYQRLKENYFIRTAVGYYVGASTTLFPRGYWRVERTDIGTLADGVWTEIKSQAITAGENEFVLQWLAGADYNYASGYTGGFHLGEKIEDVTGAWVEFVADGNRLSLDADIPLTPCKSFYYREYSAIYQHNDNTIAAWHLKETTFKDGGYETVNDVKFVQALDYFAYPGIACVSRWLSEKAMPEGVATITDMGDGTGTAHYDFQSNKHRIHYEGNGYICDVDSEVLIGADDSQCSLAVYNAADYNKYYRRNPDTVGSTSNRLKGRTKVRIAAL